MEVLEGGTGFMMIRRATLERFTENYPQQLYYPDHSRSEHFAGDRKITCFFDGVVDESSERYLSEDYMFCQWARRIGLKVWMCPWMRLSHVGTYVFGGSLTSLAKIGANPTSDTGKVKRGPLGKKGRKRQWKK